MKKSLEEKAALSNGKQACMENCEFWGICQLSPEIRDLCSSKYKLGYVRGYRQSKRDMKQEYTKS